MKMRNAGHDAPHAFCGIPLRKILQSDGLARERILQEIAQIIIPSPCGPLLDRLGDDKIGGKDALISLHWRVHFYRHRDLAVQLTPAREHQLTNEPGIRSEWKTWEHRSHIESLHRNQLKQGPTIHREAD
jgi:hypothetical protein